MAGATRLAEAGRQGQTRRPTSSVSDIDNGGYRIAHRANAVIFACGLLALAHAAWSGGGGCAAEALAGYGASLQLFGLGLVGWPMLRKGSIDEAVAGAMPQDHRIFATPHMPGLSERRNQMRADLRISIIGERIIAAIVIAVGTVLSGYAPLLTRMLGASSC